MWFPIDSGVATLQNGVWEIDFGNYRTDRVIQWISLVGPVSSTVNVYINTIFVDTTARGDFNRADYYKGIPLARGQQLRLVWNIGTGSAPQASIGATDGIESVGAQQSASGLIFTAGE
jgi:hypothetical protein